MFTKFSEMMSVRQSASTLVQYGCCNPSTEILRDWSVVEVFLSSLISRIFFEVAIQIPCILEFGVSCEVNGLDARISMKFNLVLKETRV